MLGAVREVIATAVGPAHPVWAQSPQAVVIRGHQQSLYIYGSPRGEPVIVSSGDGGWIHLGPHVARVPRQRGFFVIGFDVKVYLSSFTSERDAATEEEPADYRVLTEFAKKATGKKPILSASPRARDSRCWRRPTWNEDGYPGVIGLGLPDPERARLALEGHADLPDPPGSQ